MSALTFEEQRAVRRAWQIGFESPWAFPAPPGCRSLEEWAKDGGDRWTLIHRRLWQSLPTAHDSPMLEAAA